ncbi:hypothetical protein BC834DRAFT_878466 [Gloeopeniophorella convolvens]|nr:hypothetical protein BC834DRAFT_878466 [Gloeopeniophorella convolvens]
MRSYTRVCAHRQRSCGREQNRRRDVPSRREGQRAARHELCARPVVQAAERLATTRDHHDRPSWLL